MIKILHLTTSAEIRGSETIALSQILASQNKEIQYYLCSLRSEGKIHEFAKRHGIGAYALKADSKFLFFKAVRALRDLVDKLQIDILHVYGLEADVVARLARRKSDLKLLISAIHSVYTFRSDRLFLLDRLLSKPIDQYIANTNLGRQIHQQRLKLEESRFSSIHSGVDPQKYRLDPAKANFRDRMKLSQDTILITFLSEVNPGKGHFLAAEVMKFIKEKTKISFCLVCIGKDATGGALAAKVQELGLEKEILLLGFCEMGVIEEVLNSTDIQILPSYFEGLPTALLEAMGYEIPIVATAVGGIPELVLPGETGLLSQLRNAEFLAHGTSSAAGLEKAILASQQFQPDDVRDFANMILVLMEDEEKRKKLGRQGRIRLEESFSIQGMTERMEAKYLELLNIKGF